MNRSDSIGQLATALAKAQAKVHGASKDKTNPHLKSKYADLASIWDAARDALGLRVTLMRTRTRFAHTITHHAIDVQLWRGTFAGRSPRGSSRARWTSASGDGLALTALAKRLLAAEDTSASNVRRARPRARTKPRRATRAR